MAYTWLIEQLQTITNLTDVAQILIALNREDLLPTILELIHKEAQDITDTYCVVEEVNDYINCT